MVRALLSTLLFCSSLFAEAQRLFPFVENGKWGYKDIQSSWVIQPQYEAAQLFSEGKAAVREGGYYHFIDSVGQRLTGQKFELVNNFELGLSSVYHDGSWALIDSGFQILNDGFEYLYVANSKLVVGRKDSLQVILNHKGQLLISGLEVMLIDSISAVLRLGPDAEYRYGVISSDGRIDTIPLKDCTIKRCGDEIFAVTSTDDRESLWSLQGELFCNFPEGYSVHWDSHGFPLILHKGGNREFEYQILNRSGQLIEVPDFDRFYAASSDRFIGYIRGRGLLLLDSNLDTLSDVFLRFSESASYEGSSFLNGTAIISYHDQWCLIDTNFNVLQNLELSDDFERSIYHITPRFAIVEEQEFIYDLLDLNTGEITPGYTQVEYLDRKEVKVVLRDGERMTYITSSDFTVHHEGGSSGSTNNITYMVSNAVTHTAVEFGEQQAPKKEGFYIEIDTTLMVLSRDSSYSGPLVRIVNNSNEPLLYDSEEREMILYIEALDTRDSIWKPISYNINYRCLSLGFRVETIDPNTTIYRTIPKFEGGMNTVMRVRFERVFNEGVEEPKVVVEREERIVNGEIQIIEKVRISSHEPSWPLESSNYREVISNEVPCSINPAQFWNTDLSINW